MATAKQKKANRENAKKSTGPNTEEGKLASRANALKHGMTAQVVALHDEDPLEIAARKEAWVEAFQPESVVEAALVDQIASHTLKLNRCSRVENEIVAKQVREAEADWFAARSRKLHELTRLYQTDPVRAVTEMRRFGAGVQWLLDRWEELKQAFDKHSRWNNMGAIREVVRLSGYDPDNLKHGETLAADIALIAICCVKNHDDYPAFTNFLEKQVNPRYLAIYGTNAKYPHEEAVSLAKKRIDAEIEFLNMFKETYEPLDEAEFESVQIMAMVPKDTPENRFFLRYAKSAESGFDRALKTLAKVQAERQKMQEKEIEPEPQKAPEPALQNEANSGANPVYPGGYVKLNGSEYVVEDMGDGHIMMSPVDAYPADWVLPPDVTQNWTA